MYQLSSRQNCEPRRRYEVNYQAPLRQSQRNPKELQPNSSYTHSDWTQKHVKQMKELLEQETGGIHVWDELFDRAFELCDYHQLSAFNVHDGVRVKDFVDGEARGCAKSIIQAHA
jgi:hypothetical protein